MKEKLTFNEIIGVIVAMFGLFLASAEPIDPADSAWPINLLGLVMFAIPCLIVIKNQKKDEQKH